MRKIVILKLLLLLSVAVYAQSEPAGNPVDSLLKNPEINDTIKGELALEYAKTKHTYADVIDFLEKYGNYLVTKEQQLGIVKMLGKLSEIREGEVAADFRFPDINNKEIALSDFRGKIVYIDAWATWCGPCKAQIPYLKSLEKEYHGNDDIVFLGVSIDARKNFDKWKNFVIKEELKGIQLFAGDKAQKEFRTPYKILGIPRFILVGKDGEIISSDAPQPSSSKIRPLLESLLESR
jgi:thiol-disulfide isomerase/thioredoxin